MVMSHVINVHAGEPWNNVDHPDYVPTLNLGDTPSAVVSAPKAQKALDR